LKFENKIDLQKTLNRTNPGHGTELQEMQEMQDPHFYLIVKPPLRESTGFTWIISSYTRAASMLFHVAGRKVSSQYRSLGWTGLWWVPSSVWPALPMSKNMFAPPLLGNLTPAAIADSELLPKQFRVHTYIHTTCSDCQLFIYSSV
jgi:hypothetical protein